MVEGVAREERISTSSETFRKNGFHFFKMKNYSANSMMAHLHMHDAIEFIYCNEGSVRINLDEKEFSIYPGDLTLFRSRGIHCIFSEDEEINNYYVLKISTQFLSRFLPSDIFKKILLRFMSLDSSFKTVWNRDELKGTRIYEALQNLIRESESPTNLTEVSQLSSVLTILHEICKNDDVDFNTKILGSDVIYKALVYVNDNFDSEISAEEVSKKFGMSLGYFSRSFKAATGKSFKDYLIGIRFNKAELLLANTDLSVTEIAMQCGYPNVSHFIALYKKYRGTTPLKTRKNKT